MKKKKKTLLLFWVLCVISVLACNDDNEESNINYKEEYEKKFSDLKCLPPFIQTPKDSIIGKWKLVRLKDFETKILKDYSCDTIIYEFYSDNRLIVTSNINEYENGEFYYEYNVFGTPQFPTKILIAPNLTIDKLEKWYCTVEEISMSIGGNGQKYSKIFVKHQ